MRIGLDGQPVEPVNAEHRIRAIEAMTKIELNKRSITHGDT